MARSSVTLSEGNGRVRPPEETLLDHDSSVESVHRRDDDDVLADALETVVVGALQVINDIAFSRLPLDVAADLRLRMIKGDEIAGPDAVGGRREGDIITPLLAPARSLLFTIELHLSSPPFLWIPGEGFALSPYHRHSAVSSCSIVKCYTGGKALVRRTSMAPEQKAPINVKADDQTIRGHYANSMMVSHSREEFILDFINHVPPQPMLVGRIITSPGHLKRIISALAENLKRYEQSYGAIQAAVEPNREIGFKAD